MVESRFGRGGWVKGVVGPGVVEVKSGSKGVVGSGGGGGIVVGIQGSESQGVVG